MVAYPPVEFYTFDKVRKLTEIVIDPFITSKKKEHEFNVLR